MTDSGMFWAPAGHFRRGAAAATAVALAFTSAAVAQQPVPAPVAPKAQSKNPRSEPARSAGAGAEPSATQGTAPQLVFSPWIKICGKDGPEDSNAKQVCAVMTAARVEDGKLAVSVSLVQPADRMQNILRVTLPLGVRVAYGTRVIIDQGTPLQSGYILCLAGCLSDYEAGPDLVEKLKKGHNLTVQAIDPNESPINLDIPLEGFAKAFDGPATDEKVAAAQQKKLEEQLKARAEETRKKLQAQQGTGTPPGPPPANPPPAGK